MGGSAVLFVADAVAAIRNSGSGRLRKCVSLCVVVFWYVYGMWYVVVDYLFGMQAVCLYGWDAEINNIRLRRRLRLAPGSKRMID